MTDFDYRLANHAIRVTSDRSDSVYLWFWPQMTAIGDRMIIAAKQDMWEARREPRGHVFCGERRGKQYDLTPIPEWALSLTVPSVRWWRRTRFSEAIFTINAAANVSL